MNFEELQKSLAEQATLAKSLSAAQVTDDAAAAAAAGTAGAQPLVKSFKLLLEDGTEMEAQDATEMLKCLVEKIGDMEGAQRTASEEVMKSFGGTVDLIATLTEGLKATREDVLAISRKNGELVAANAELTKSLAAMGGQGRGRRSVDVVLGARPNLDGKSGAGGGGADALPTRQEIMAKAQSALTAGRISATEAIKVETALNMNVMPEKAILEHLFKA